MAQNAGRMEHQLSLLMSPVGGTEEEDDDTAALSPEWHEQQDDGIEGEGPAGNWLSHTFGDDSTVAEDLENVRDELETTTRLTRFLAKRLGACHSGLFKSKECHLQLHIIVKFKQWAQRRVDLRACWLSARRRSTSRMLRQVFVSWHDISIWRSTDGLVGSETICDEGKTNTVQLHGTGCASAPMAALEPSTATPLKHSVQRQYPASPVDEGTRVALTPWHVCRSSKLIETLGPASAMANEVSQLEDTAIAVERVLEMLKGTMLQRVEDVTGEMQTLEAAHAEAGTDLQVLEDAHAGKRREIKKLEAALTDLQKEVQHLTEELAAAHEHVRKREEEWEGREEKHSYEMEAMQQRLKNIEASVHDANNVSNIEQRLHLEECKREIVRPTDLQMDSLVGMDRLPVGKQEKKEEDTQEKREEEKTVNVEEIQKLNTMISELERRLVAVDHERQQQVAAAVVEAAEEAEQEAAEECAIMERMASDPQECIRDLRAKYLHETEESKRLSIASLPAKSTVGVVLDKKTVAFVVPGGPAGRPRKGSPLAQGDTLLTIDGVPTKEISTELAQQLRGLDVVGSTVLLRVRKCGGTISDVVLIRQDLPTLNVTQELSMSIAHLLGSLDRKGLKKQVE